MSQVQVSANTNMKNDAKTNRPPKYGRKQKEEIIFNEQSRIEFVNLTEQRKKERRRIANKKEEKKAKEARKLIKLDSVNAIKSQYQTLVNFRNASIACLTPRELTPQLNVDTDNPIDVNTLTAQPDNIKSVSSEFYNIPGNVIIHTTRLDTTLGDDALFDEDNAIVNTNDIPKQPVGLIKKHRRIQSHYKKEGKKKKSSLRRTSSHR